MTTFFDVPLRPVAYSKLLSVKKEPFHINVFSSRRVKVDQDVLHNNLSFDRATVAPTARVTSVKDNSTQVVETDAAWEETHAKDKKMEEKNVINALREYVVDCIVRHVEKFSNVKYIVCSYGYTPADDMMEPRTPPFTSISIQAVGLGCRNKTKRDKDREREMQMDKERTPPTVQMSPSMMIDRQNPKKCPGYMVQSWMICQGKK